MNFRSLVIIMAATVFTAGFAQAKTKTHYLELVSTSDAPARSGGKSKSAKSKSAKSKSAKSKSAKSKSSKRKSSKKNVEGGGRLKPDTATGNLQREVVFDGSTVNGQYHSAGEAVAKVEQEKQMNDLIGMRRDFKDRLASEKERLKRGDETSAN